LRCVFDTNIFVSAFVFPDSNARRAFRLARREAMLLLSPATIEELREVLMRERFRKYFSAEDARRFLSLVGQEADWINPTVRITACRDPKDNKFLEVALDGRATHIVTGDKDLLVLDPYATTRIISPRDFLLSSSPESRA
jgi:uncharacterized protein